MKLHEIPSVIETIKYGNQLPMRYSSSLGPIHCELLKEGPHKYENIYNLFALFRLFSFLLGGVSVQAAIVNEAEGK